MTEYNIRLNPNCASPVHTGLKFKSGDKGISFVIAVDELDTAGTTAKIVFLRANGTSVERNITETNGVFTYKTLGNEFAVPGKTVADVKFYTGTDRVSTASFVFEVSADTMDGLGAGAGGYSDRLEQLVSEAESAGEQAIAEAEAATAQAKAELEAAETDMQEARAELEQLAEEIEAAESNMKAVEAEMSNVLQEFKEQYGEVGALNPRGDWNSSTTYQIRDVVYYGGFSWTALATNKGVTPSEANKATWGKHMDMDGIEQKIANIQTTSRATLSQAGWYRVAEYKGTANAIRGARSNSCEIVIKRGYGDSANEEHRLLLNSVYRTQEFDAISCYSPSTANHYVTKIRYVYVETELKAYIEIYYSANAENDVFAIIGDGLDFSTESWKAIDFIPTSEIVSGVTVTATYDIPSNATPVNSVDLENTIAVRTPKLTFSLSTGTTEAEINNTLDTLSDNYPNYSLYECQVRWNVSHSKFGGGVFIINGWKYTNDYGYQTIQYDGWDYEYKRYKNKGGWQQWFKSTTEKDLANYFKNTGGFINGNVYIQSDKAEQRILWLKNSLRSIYQEVFSDGNYYLYDKTNGKPIITSTVDGTNTFYGTASGNLPLNGGGTVQAANSNPLKVKNTSGNDCYIPFVGKGGTLGYLGFSDTDSLMFVTADAAAATVILHTGNSARVVPATSAPSDTTVLWIDTANKKVKSYIDGAWTALA